jgi:uncharacterized protein YcbK (DUF882 family)
MLLAVYVRSSVMVMVKIFRLLILVILAANFFATQVVADSVRCQMFLEILHEKSELMTKLKAQGNSPDPALEKRVGRLERLETRIRARPERQFWNGLKLFETDEDVRIAVESGELVALDKRPPLTTGQITYDYTLPEARLLARQITFDFVQRLKEKSLYSENIKLLITSAVRPVSFQRKLIADGAPAATRSSHTYGIAFDIAKKWFEENNPEVARVLHQTLRQYANRGEIHLVREDHIGVWHVAITPSKLENLREQISKGVTFDHLWGDNPDSMPASLARPIE